MAITMTTARPDQLPAILELLARSELPPDGLGDHLATTLLACDAAAIVGSAALELYGTDALLRSVAVDAAYRGQGLGMRLTAAALDLARRRGVCAAYLLTETAGGFFPRFGFVAVGRAAVPAAVLQSVEFTTACPVSALVLRADL